MRLRAPFFGTVVGRLRFRGVGWWAGLGILALAAGLTLFPQQASAQYGPGPWNNVEDPSDEHLSYTFWFMSPFDPPYVPVPHVGNILYCVSLNILSPSFPLRRSCLDDMREEDRLRREIRHTDHWIQSGVQTAAQMWRTVQTIRDIIQETRGYHDVVSDVISGFGRDQPEATAHKVREASDRFERRLEEVERSQREVSLPEAGHRFEAINRVVQQSLSVAENAQATAARISENAAQARARLSDGRQINIEPIGGGQPSFLDPARRPPLPHDAAADALDFYEAYSGAERPASPSSGASAAASATHGVAFANVDMGPAETVALDDAGGEDEACTIDPDGTEDPSVIFQRAEAQALGAQASATAVSGEIGEQRQQLRAIRAREDEGDWGAGWRAFFTAISHF